MTTFCGYALNVGGSATQFLRNSVPALPLLAKNDAVHRFLTLEPKGSNPILQNKLKTKTRPIGLVSIFGDTSHFRTYILLKILFINFIQKSFRIEQKSISVRFFKNTQKCIKTTFINCVIIFHKQIIFFCKAAKSLQLVFRNAS